MGMDGQPQGPHLHIHILPCPYYTRAWRHDSSYSRGEWGEDVVGRAFMVYTCCLHLPPAAAAGTGFPSCLSRSCVRWRMLASSFHR